MKELRETNDIIRDDGSHPPVKSTAKKQLLSSGTWLGARMLVLLACLALVCLIPLALADPAPNPIATSPNGTSGVVNGGLYVKALQPVPFADQGVGTSHTFVANFTLPTTPSSIKWARLYEIWSACSDLGIFEIGYHNIGVNATTWFNGNGDLINLGNEQMATTGSRDGYCWWINDHTNRIYSDYMVWYNVTSYTTRSNPSVVLHDEAVPGCEYIGGQLKAVALVVAYNVSRGSPGTIYYWVNQGQEWFNGTAAEGGVYPYLDNDSATFDTSGLAGQTTSSATLTELSTAENDATYKFNGNALTNGTLGGQFDYYENHTWGVYSGSTIASSSVFNFKNSTSGGWYNIDPYSIQLATLSITNPHT